MRPLRSLSVGQASGAYKGGFGARNEQILISRQSFATALARKLRTQ